MKKIMKKLSLFLVVVMLVTTLITPAITANAVVYPSITMNKESQNATISYYGQSKLYFKAINSFASERYHINLYNSSYELMGEATDTLYNTTNSYTDITITINPEELGLTHGLYIVECYMSFFTDGEWYQNAYKNTYTINIQKDELRKVNGVWKYYKNDVYTSATGLIKYDGKWFYVNKGKWDNSVTGLIKHEGKWFYVNKGKWTKSTTDLIKYNGEWFFVKNGKWDKTIDTLFKKSGKWFFIKNGKWSKEKTIVKYNGKKFYVNKGYAQLDYSGKVKINGKTYKIKNGKVV